MGRSRQDLLRQFDADHAVYRWLDLPRLLEQRSMQRWRDGMAALAVVDLECAVTADILQNSLVRLTNVREAKICGEEVNILLPIGRKDPVRLKWPRHKVKNRVGIEVELPSDASRRLKLLTSSPYRDAAIRFHGNIDSVYLFPGKNRRGLSTARGNLGSTFRDRCIEFGIVVTPHLARSIAAEIIQRHGPHMLPLLHHLLGNSSAVAEKFYTRPRADLAVRKFHNLLDQARSDQKNSAMRGG
jgi:hypothetical protein